jgi:hypothetical protein
MDYIQEENIEPARDFEVIEQATSLEHVNVKWLTQFLTLTSVAVFLPFFVHTQLITGPIVNAILILVLVLTGVRSALLVACLPSMMALFGGLLPIVLAPAIPFIILSNIIFVLTINWFLNSNQEKNKAYWSGALVASGVKFVFLLFSVNILATLFIKGSLVTAIAQMMGWMQLVTAIIGAGLAYVALKFLKILQ